MIKFLALITLLLSSAVQGVQGQAFDCLSLDLKPLQEFTYSSTPTGDFAFRDTLPSTDIEKSRWNTCCGSFGPCPFSYPKVHFPEKQPRLEWLQTRIIEAAKKWIGLPYLHRHIPEMGGLDCSNFTAFVYNYALGKRFSSNVKRQSEEAGRRLLPSETLAPGDLLFLYDEAKKEISHTAIYIDATHVIDSTDGGVKIRAFSKRYKKEFAWARRVLE